LVEAIYNGEAKELTRKAIEMALGGDSAMMKICQDRLLPPLKTRLLRLQLPQLTTAADAVNALAAIAQALANGQVLPEAASALTETVQAFLRGIEVSALETRLSELENWRSESREAAQGNHYNA
jgi:hypothetical protein